MLVFKQVKIIQNYEIKGEDGNWYTAFNAPYGVRATGEKRESYVSIKSATHPHVTVNKSFKTKSEAETYCEEFGFNVV